MSDRDLLLRAILSDPADDIARLVYADKIEEEGECERAEFIRVGVESAQPDPCGSSRKCVYGPTPPAVAPGDMVYFCGEPECIDRHNLRRRERELILAGRNAVEWRGDLITMFPTGRSNFTRGFVSGISLPCAGFMRHAEALFRAHPIEAVTLTDARFYRTPMSAEDERPWSWMYNGEVTGQMLYHETPRWWWKTEADARTGLSDYCVAVGRKLANLPTLEAAHAA